MLLFLPSWPPSSSPHVPLPLSSLLPHSPSSLPKVLTKCFPGGFFGEDREGNPVWYDAMGNIDFKGQTSKEFDHMIITRSSHDHHMSHWMCTGLHRSAKKEDIIKLKVSHLETTIKYLKEHSERVRKQHHPLWCCILKPPSLLSLPLSLSTYTHAEREAYWEGDFNHRHGEPKLSTSLPLAGHHPLQRSEVSLPLAASFPDFPSVCRGGPGNEPVSLSSYCSTSCRHWPCLMQTIQREPNECW